MKFHISFDSDSGIFSNVSYKVMQKQSYFEDLVCNHILVGS